MTERLYYTDPYLREFDARVTRIEPRDGGALLTLDRTAFYPTSGGQPFDIGALDDLRVVDAVDEEDGSIGHVVEIDRAGQALPAPGQLVHGTIDWARRFDHMQQHTGQHVLSAAFDREPTTCRDLCVKSHTNVELTDPAGYTFPVATDSACRNRLLHSRPVDGSEYLPKLWRAGIRGFQAVFNVPGDDVRTIVASYRAALEALAGGVRPDVESVRAAVGSEFTRGHFARAV